MLGTPKGGHKCSNCCDDSLTVRSIWALQHSWPASMQRSHGQADAPQDPLCDVTEGTQAYANLTGTSHTGFQTTLLYTGHTILSSLWALNTQLQALAATGDMRVTFLAVTRRYQQCQEGLQAQASKGSAIQHKCLAPEHFVPGVRSDLLVTCHYIHYISLTAIADFAGAAGNESDALVRTVIGR